MKVLIVLAFFLSACVTTVSVPPSCANVGPAMLDVNAAYDARAVSQADYDRIAYLWDSARGTCGSMPPVDTTPVVAFLSAAGKATGKVYQ